MNLFNRKALKENFKKKKFKIGYDVLRDFIIFCEEIIEKEIDEVVREAKISGRKIIRKEDFFKKK